MSEQRTDSTPKATLSALHGGQGRNSIGFLRFLLASLVVYSHSFRLGAFGPEPLLRSSGETLGTLSVHCFFVLSGFLIARSYERTASLPRFLWHRVLRIFPGFWVCLLVTAFGAGAILYRHDTGALHGFLALEPLGYVRNNFFLTMHQAGLGALLSTTPFGTHLNGALWSLRYEFLCYLLVAAVGVLGLLRRFPRVGLAVLSVMFVVLWLHVRFPAWHLLRPIISDSLTPPLVMWFVAGMLFHGFSSRIPLNTWLFLAMAALAVWALMTAHQSMVGPLCISYVLFWLAARLPLSWWDRHGDFSYGLYIYAFPVQQTLAAYHFHRHGFLAYFSACLVLATLLAVASYRLVEGPALRLKNLGRSKAPR